MRAFTTKRSIHDKRMGYWLLVPATIMLVLISVVPLCYGIFLGFTNRHFLKPEQRDFVGLKNFIDLIHDSEFIGVLGFSIFYTVMVVLLSYLVGLVLALVLSRDIKFRGIYRVLFLIPWVVPSVVVMTNWMWVLNDQIGFVNTTLQALHIIKSPILFFADPGMARMTVIMIGFWQSTPFMMITLLSGLQSIPKDMYEAAKIDGAGFFKSLWYLTLPMIKSVSFISITLMFIWTFNNFDKIWLLTKGGPNNATFTLPILSYFTAFYRSNISYAAAIATTIMVVMLILCIINLKIQFRTDDKIVKSAVKK